MVGSVLPDDKSRSARAFPAFKEHPERKRLWVAGFVAAATAAISNVIVFFIAKEFAGINFNLAPQTGGEDFMSIGIIQVVLASVLPAFVATGILAFLIKRFRERAQFIFWFISIVAFFVSLIAPLSLEADSFTKAALSVMHVVAAITITSVLLKYQSKTITHQI